MAITIPSGFVHWNDFGHFFVNFAAQSLYNGAGDAVEDACTSIFMHKNKHDIIVLYDQGYDVLVGLLNLQ